MPLFLRSCFLTIAALAGLNCLSGCAAFREPNISNHALHLIYAQRPALRHENLVVQHEQAQWFPTVKSVRAAGVAKAHYFYAVVRFAADPDSRYRVIIVEQRIAHPGATPIAILRDGLARDVWEKDKEDPHLRTLRQVFLHPKAAGPRPPRDEHH